MLINTRRRILGLLAATVAAPYLLRPIRPAFAAKNECFELKPFGAWKGLATNTQSGAKIGQIEFSSEDCDLRAEIQVSPSFDSKLVVYGDPDATPLPKDFLVKADNRLIVKSEDGSPAIDEQLCGVCTEIRDDKVTTVLPLAAGALFRSSKSVDITIKLGEKEQCSFTLNCEDLRQALDWATDRQAQLAKDFDAKACTPTAQECFITSACCEVLGLADDCFELTALRRYRDEVLMKMPDGAGEIALYYCVAPAILAEMPREERAARLGPLYARYILPSAVAAWLGFDGLTYRLYGSMMRSLMREFAVAEQ
jgi:hypothetical protein